MPRSLKLTDGSCGTAVFSGAALGASGLCKGSTTKCTVVLFPYGPSRGGSRGPVARAFRAGHFSDRVAVDAPLAGQYLAESPLPRAMLERLPAHE